MDYTYTFCVVFKYDSVILCTVKVPTVILFLERDSCCCCGCAGNFCFALGLKLVYGDSAGCVCYIDCKGKVVD